MKTSQKLSKNRKRRKPIEYIDYKNIHSGETVYVIGSGNSLRNFDFNSIRNNITFAFNNAIFHIPFLPTYYYILDRCPKIEYIYEHLKSDEMKYSIKFGEDDFIRVNRIKGIAELYNDEGVQYAPWSIIIVIELCLFMGFKDINILGIDLVIYKYHHFWDMILPTQEIKRRETKKYISQMDGFQRFNGEDYKIHFM